MKTENDILMEIVNLASIALSTDLIHVKRQTLADIYAAIASALPVDNRHEVGGEDTAETVRSCHGAAPSAVPSEEPQGIAKFLTVAEGVQLVRFAGKDEIKLVARRKGQSGNPNTIFEINVLKQLKCADVYRDGCRLFSILGSNANYCRVEKMAVSALHRWFEDRRPSKRARKRMRRLREGILTPEQELADTIARQKEEY